MNAPPLRHGRRCESMAIKIYEQVTGSQVSGIVVSESRRIWPLPLSSSLPMTLGRCGVSVQGAEDGYPRSFGAVPEI